MKQSVGKGGVNDAPDVRQVQEALTGFARKLSIAPLKADGRCGPITIDAIMRFQKAIRMPEPNGLVAPGGKTAEALGLKSVPPVAKPAGSLSGAAWWKANQAKWPNESRVDALAEPFKGNVVKFLAALRKAGASVQINATTRSMTRAKLMRNSWDVANGLVDPARVPAIPGVDITWDHGDLRKSRAAAAEMVALFAIKKQPSLNSNHLRGHAIDMTISWSGELKIAKADGKPVGIKSAPRNGTNKELHAVGATYSVLHLLPDDPPHWSITGR